MFLVTLALLFLLLLVLLSRGLGFWAFVITGAASFVIAGIFSMVSWFILFGVTIPFVIVAVVLGVPALRTSAVSRRALRVLGGALPSMSETERIALEAGTVGWDAELFCGNPDWNKLLDFRSPELSTSEQMFLDGPVEELCSMLDDWEINRTGQDLGIHPGLGGSICTCCSCKYSAASSSRSDPSSPDCWLRLS